MGKSSQKRGQGHVNPHTGQSGPSQLDELLKRADPLRSVENGRLASLGSGAGTNGKEIVTHSAEIDPGQYLKGVEPVGVLPTHTTTTPIPAIALDIPGKELDSIADRVDVEHRTNGIGWVLSKPGKSEFVKPKFTDSTEFCGQHFDEKQAVERCKSEGYDTVYMTVSHDPTIGNFREMRLSQERIRKATGTDVEVRLLAITSESPQLGRAKAYMMNPDVASKDADTLQEAAEKLQKDYYGRTHEIVDHLSRKSNVMLAAKHGTKDQLTRRLVPEVTKTMKEYMVLAFGDDEAASSHQRSLDSNDRLISKCVEEKSMALMFVHSVHHLEQLAFKRFLEDTNVVRPVEISNLPKGLIGLSENARQSIPAAVALTGRTQHDKAAWDDVIWPVATATPPLGSKALIIKPLVDTMLEAGLKPNQVTLEAISENTKVIGDCYDKRPKDYEAFELAVSLALTRGKLRDEITKVPFPPLILVDDPKVLFKEVLDNESLPKDVRTRLTKRVEHVMEHSLEELKADDDLAYHHRFVIGEVLGKGVLDEGNALVAQTTENERIIALGNKELMLAVLGKNVSKKKRSGFNPTAHRTNLTRQNEAIGKTVDVINGLFEDVDFGEGTTGILERLSELQEVADEKLVAKASVWVTERDKHEKTSIPELFGGSMAKAAAAMKPARNIKVDGVTSQEIFDGATELARDIVCVYRSGDMDKMQAGIAAESRLLHDEWKDMDVSPTEFPQLAREVVLAKTVLGENHAGYTGYQQIIGEKITDPGQQASYAAIEKSYEEMGKSVESNL
ncbi:hypothetical protein ACFLRF_03590 [Candidatus Altiarchaeota archaeon]